VEIAVWLTVVVFVVLTGANDGGALLAMGAKLPGRGTWQNALILVLFVSIAPALMTTVVAQTFVTRLVPLDDSGGARMMMIGVSAAMAVVAVLTASGLPTSLTLAVIGGLVGASAGSDRDVDLHVVAWVLAAGFAAPLLGAALGAALVRLLARWAPKTAAATRTVGIVHLVAFHIQCLAYALNDGQKMLAVAAVAAGVTVGHTAAWQLALPIGVGYLAGLVLGLPKLVQSLNHSVFQVRPEHAVSAEMAAGSAVLGAAALGAPVSMTQALTGGIVGAGAGINGLGRIRWRAALRLGCAWLLTLPTAALLAIVVATFWRA
jgi:PiT family inorganic phosphate transporter